MPSSAVSPPVPGAEASVLAGCDVGIIRSDDNGDTWRRIDTPMNDTAVWAIAFDPNNPQVGFRRHRHPPIRAKSIAPKTAAQLGNCARWQ